MPKQPIKAESSFFGKEQREISFDSATRKFLTELFANRGGGDNATLLNQIIQSQARIEKKLDEHSGSLGSGERAELEAFRVAYPVIVKVGNQLDAATPDQ